MSVIIPTNRFQTAITEEWLKQYPEEVREQFMDFIDTVPLIKWMISEDRPRAKDLPRDERGRIIVDITHPHILEDMDYFRPAAKFYQENGCYTLLKPNANPNSEYGKWFAEEVRRCREGYVRESDGEWVTGIMYYYLNYCPIMLNRRDEESGIFVRTESFPDFWEGIYYRFHYIDAARRSGKHAMELARRGASKSYSLAAIMSRNLLLGERKPKPKERTRLTTVLTASTKEYLSDKDGTFTKFSPIVDFCAANTEFPRLMLKRSPSEMIWRMGYKTPNGNEMGSLNSVMGLSVKDDEGKIRGKRGYILYEEMGCHLKGTEVLMYDGSIKTVEDVMVGDSLMGDNGTPRIVQEIHHGYDMMYNVTLTNGDNQIVNSNHLVPYIVRDWYRDTDTFTTATAPELMRKDLTRGCYIPKANIKYEHQDVAIDPYLLGLWLGDGDKTWSSIVSADVEIRDYILSTFPDAKVYNLVISEKCKNYYIPAKYGVVRNLRRMGLLNNKHVPDSYIYNDEETQLALLAGLIDTDGDYLRNKHSEYFEVIQNREHLCILKAAKRIASNLGFRCSLRSKTAGKSTKKPGETYYRLCISGDLYRIPTRIRRKQADNKQIKYRQRRNNNYYGFKVSEYGYGEFYGFTVDGNHLFLLEDMTITHNSYPNFKETWDNVRDSVKEGNHVFSEMIAVGTAGDNESDFSGVKTILYNPDAYEVYALENVFDKRGKGTTKFAFFFPSYISRAGCMDKDGNSDVTKALMQILMERYMVKQGGDAASLLSRIAQMPITPAEAILKVKSNFFPVVMLNERIRQLDMDPHAYDDVYVGELVDVGGKVEFRSTDDTPIRKWPVDNTEQGALEIYEMPCSGNIPTHRYIIGVDPVDNDQAESTSLFSCFVFDLFTDNIVAEYTGRKPFANDNYEIVRLLCIFYNATCLYESNKKGLFSYFATKRCTWMLADCPDYLRERQLVKYSMFGSAAHPYSEKVYTPDGIKQWGDIEIGSRLFAPDGTVTTVTGIPVDRECDIYEITLRDGRVVHASDDHIWSVCKGARVKKRPNVLMSTVELMNDIAYTRSRDYVNHSYPESKYYIEKNAGVEYPEQFIPIPPYLLGLLLGDGCMSNIQRCKGNKAYFTSVPEDMLVYSKVLGFTYTTVDDRHHWIDIPDWSEIVYYLKLDGCNSKTKFIPDCYKYNTRDVRLDLLRGLLDTDGTIKREGGTPTYCTTSEILANDVCEISRSIGVNCSMKITSNSYGKIYTIRFYTMERMFNLPRKYSKQRKTRCRDNYTGIVSIKSIGKEKAKCVTVDREDGLYLIGEFVTTHNCKGVTVNAGVNFFANGLIKDWLNKTYTVDVKDERGEVHQEEVPQLYRLRNRALLQELISYAPEVNTDRVSALAQVMLYRENFIVLYGGSPSAEGNNVEDASDDEFFDRDWKRHQERLGLNHNSTL